MIDRFPKVHHLMNVLKRIGQRIISLVEQLSLPAAIAPLIFLKIMRKK
jgi:hypothetical protein